MTTKKDVTPNLHELAPEMKSRIDALGELSKLFDGLRPHERELLLAVLRYVEATRRLG